MKRHKKVYCQDCKHLDYYTCWFEVDIVDTPMKKNVRKMESQNIYELNAENKCQHYQEKNIFQKWFYRLFLNP